MTYDDYYNTTTTICAVALAADLHTRAQTKARKGKAAASGLPGTNGFDGSRMHGSEIDSKERKEKRTGRSST